mmetsp:Transcript_49361/g.111028  ORF Transcript_49361/g.111028 Transcript_49361/m.111028 type:complete len:229 (+) Transcript_49361:604-1290(+)
MAVLPPASPPSVSTSNSLSFVTYNGLTSPLKLLPCSASVVSRRHSHSPAGSAPLSWLSCTSSVSNHLHCTIDPGKLPTSPSFASLMVRKWRQASGVATVGKRGAFLSNSSEPCSEVGAGAASWAGTCLSRGTSRPLVRSTPSSPLRPDRSSSVSMHGLVCSMAASAFLVDPSMSPLRRLSEVAWLATASEHSRRRTMPLEADSILSRVRGPRCRMTSSSSAPSDLRHS